VSAKRTTQKRKPTLRDAQKADTRRRLLEAARNVFYREGYYGATVDQIVAEAGASRPTFYLHFKDKEEVLGVLVAEYAARAVPCMERLPGPRPTLDGLEEWLGEVGRFIEKEVAVYSVLG
jgi:AcrR family transcriptional regulator